MIVSRIGTDLDIIVSIPTMTRGVARLFAEIPVGHVYPSSLFEEGFHVLEDLDSHLMRLEVVEGGEEKEGIEGLESWNLGELESLSEESERISQTSKSYSGCNLFASSIIPVELSIPRYLLMVNDEW